MFQRPVLLMVSGFLRVESVLTGSFITRPFFTVRRVSRSLFKMRLVFAVKRVSTLTRLFKIRLVLAL